MVKIDWEKLSFAFMPTKSNIRFHYANGKWSEGELTSSYDITMSVAANVMHYGQAAFEGGKAFRCKDGKVRAFRPDENGKRLNSSARRLLMPEFPVEKFVEAVPQHATGPLHRPPCPPLLQLMNSSTLPSLTLRKPALTALWPPAQAG